MNTCHAGDITDSPLGSALERLRIPAIWVMLNLPGKPARSCRSPFREDRHPSFSIYDDGRRWKDYATGEGGDAVDFIAKALGISNEDACRKLIDMAGTRREKSAFPAASAKVEPSRKFEPYDP